MSNDEKNWQGGACGSPQETKPVLSILIVSYQTCEMTLECLRSISREAKSADYEVLIVDNNSSDGSPEAIAAEFPNYKLLASKDNLGFARGNNVAAEEARGEYLLLLNPDTVVLNSAIDKLLDFAKAHSKAGIWGGKTLYGDKSLNPTSCWRKMSVWNIFCRTSGLTGLLPKSEVFNSESYGAWTRNNIREVDIVTGCFLLITRDLWQRLDGFDPAFFMYGEEADLCLRAAALGAKPIVTPNAEIIHYGGASEKEEVSKMVRLFKGKVSLINRHFSPVSKRVGLFLFSLWPLSRAYALKCAGFILRNKDYTERGQVWHKIWSHRGEWISGYE